MKTETKEPNCTQRTKAGKKLSSDLHKQAHELTGEDLLCLLQETADKFHLKMKSGKTNMNQINAVCALAHSLVKKYSLD